MARFLELLIDDKLITINESAIASFTETSDGRTELIDNRGGSVVIDLSYEDVQSYFTPIAQLY